MMFHQLTGLHRVHFVGVGGAGMSGIAEILLDYDIEVSGSDLVASETTRRLERLGARVFLGHQESNVEGSDLVVFSSAVQGTNLEVVAARRAGIATVRRAEMLAELMRLKYGIAIAGTHGKTTTTSLTGTLLTEAGLDPTVIVGGRLRVTGTGARHGRGDFMVVEADEFDRSFLTLAPIIAVITNIDQDHLDTYRDLDEIHDAFVRFAERVPFFGQVIVCLDDPQVQAILPRLADRRVVTYGLSPQAELSAARLEPSGEGTRFVVRHAVDGELGSVFVPMPGQHNVLNALAAVAVGRALDLELGSIGAALEKFGGVHRRFERLGTHQGAAVVDDYAHHPTEVVATLNAVRQVYPGRVCALFQPHLYSRTRDQAADFGRALLLADIALVADIYGSREEPIEGVTSQLVVEAARDSGHRNVHGCPDVEAATAQLRAEGFGDGDVILTMGAGDIYRWGQKLVDVELRS
jgi:UDP-N-acetylmuramate--alanine ligase